ncbi:MAG: hypothetical protein CL787_06170 [Chloroflexi bacterium]|nr:hypothetical protein [Chloroflexota bacterium]
MGSQNYLEAIDPTSGTWTHRFFPASGKAYFGPVLGDNGYIYQGFGDRIYAVDFSNGVDVVWESTAMLGQISSAPSLHGDVLYIGTSSGHLYALDSNTGSVLDGWPFQTNSRVNHYPVIDDDGNIYVTAADKLHKIDSNGNELWEFEPSNTSSFYCSPAVGNNQVIHAGDVYEDGLLYVCRGNHIVAIDKNGQKVWDEGVGVPIYSITLDVNENLYFGHGEYLHSIKPNGNTNWKDFNVYGRVESQVVIGANGNLYFGTNNPEKVYSIKE